ncbi:MULTISPECIES: hypothetical protein [unclassified Mycolicibacterium]|uniref:hypothetical protein n=1 Tax=unclassified Mycolicibacterium TaxID=2636767 RepID=UPI0012DD71D1|nr:MULTISPECIES: hypothetical protein [unclassified Mycolicibacterium]MUL85281.1 hypothetical protein [Mycolicibacterium sp. CBMA 329]MUL91248.1 hypothetical protein [Mycolicibacterium sp. CBMA 331]MUM02552.1 hypothetical protein [Mycolicibacterium sp. CBMA 334]MUM27761.1 hypothetical protein [Mycolicibacterium sp. CBMA 295]MUM41007.1 hypothetical protein [Mycolicibacterium sp. CBMA 247]
MANTRLVSVFVAAGVLVAGGTAATAWAGGPPGFVEYPGDVSVAVGTGEFEGTLAGFTATGATNDQASAAVIAACNAAGGAECTSDEVTNDRLCIVSVADGASGVVAGGAGVTLEAARQDALNRAAANNTPLGPNAATVVSACP